MNAYWYCCLVYPTLFHKEELPDWTSLLLVELMEFCPWRSFYKDSRDRTRDNGFKLTEGGFTLGRNSLL